MVTSLVCIGLRYTSQFYSQPAIVRTHILAVQGAFMEYKCQTVLCFKTTTTKGSSIVQCGGMYRGGEAVGGLRRLKEGWRRGGSQ